MKSNAIISNCAIVILLATAAGTLLHWWYYFPHTYLWLRIVGFWWGCAGCIVLGICYVIVKNTAIDAPQHYAVPPAEELDLTEEERILEDMWKDPKFLNMLREHRKTASSNPSDHVPFPIWRVSILVTVFLASIAACIGLFYLARLIKL